MKITGNFSIDLTGIKTAKAHVQGVKATSASVFVPLDWANKDVIVLLAKKGEVTLAPPEDSDY